MVMVMEPLSITTLHVEDMSPVSLDALNKLMDRSHAPEVMWQE